MPTSPPRLCKGTCSQATNRRSGYCEPCERKVQQRYDAQRPTAAIRGYDAKKHRPWRDDQLRREPYCIACLYQGNRVQATVADHRIPVRQGGGWSHSNGWSLCTTHHAVKRAAERRGRTVQLVRGEGFVECRVSRGRHHQATGSKNTISSGVGPVETARLESRAKPQVSKEPPPGGMAPVLDAIDRRLAQDDAGAHVLSVFVPTVPRTS